MMHELPRDGDNRLLPVYSVCSSHPLVIKAALEIAARDGEIALIEATSNQVNQFGGYTGMQAKDFRDFVTAIAAEVAGARFVLGGDHLGPNPWRELPSSVAMKHAETMVASYVAAGFQKIHLDASMSCCDDPQVLPDSTIARRAAQLCLAAEAAASAGQSPIYVIGTEVPKPGGVVGDVTELHATSATAASASLVAHKKAWAEAGLNSSWRRVAALVVQPGVEFSDDAVAIYDPAKGRDLSRWLLEQENIVFEAHSTDYQPESALIALVRDNFRILKVGPGLTFALREALYALDAIARVVVPKSPRKSLQSTLEAIMLEKPEHWIAYFGDGPTASSKRHFSYSDRIRYYWNEPQAIRSVAELLHDLEGARIPEAAVLQYLPEVYPLLPADRVITAESIIDLMLGRTLSSYATACNADEGK